MGKREKKRSGVCNSRGVATPLNFLPQEEDFIEERLEMWLDKE